MSNQDHCACPLLSSRRDCISIRYGDNKFDEECECVCHDEDDADFEDDFCGDDTNSGRCIHGVGFDEACEQCEEGPEL